MIRPRWFAALILPFMLLATAYLALASPDPGLAPAGGAPEPAAATKTPMPSNCVAVLDKVIDPSVIPLGGSVGASLSISATCGSKRLPVDLVIVGDESYSMVKGAGGGGLGTVTPTRDPANTPVVPTEDSGNDSEPAWCKEDGPSISTPTATYPWWKRTPTPGSGGETDEGLEAKGSADLIKEQKTWVKQFLSQPEIERDLASDRLHVGFVGFSGQARIKQPLTRTASSVNTAANRLQGHDLTRIDVAMREVAKVMDGSGKHDTPGRIKIVVIMSDYQFCKKDMKLRGGLDNDTIVITVGFGKDYVRRNAQSIASDRALVYDKTGLKDIVALYDQQLAPMQPVSVAHTTVRDQLADNMRLVPDSVQPVTVTITGQLLEWQLDTLPATLSYRVEPQEPGIWPISVSADAAWTDLDGLVGSALFPDVSVEVIPPTDTPTPTDTLTPTPTDTLTPTPTSTFTPTPTRTPGNKYLPILYRVWPEPTITPTPCIPEQQTIDVAFIIDTSSSMLLPTQAGGKAKLDAAIEAAIEIVNMLKPTDQATIVGFNATGQVMAQLTSDKAALIAALQRLPSTQASGTAIDEGIELAHQELQSGRHRPNNMQSIILVTDGAQTVGTPQDVRDAATAAKGDDIVIATIGLGPDIDEQLLIDVASDPELYFRAPNAEDLMDLYREIARLIPCR